MGGCGGAGLTAVMPSALTTVGPPDAAGLPQVGSYIEVGDQIEAEGAFAQMDFL